MEAVQHAAEGQDILLDNTFVPTALMALSNLTDLHARHLFGSALKVKTFSDEEAKVVGHQKGSGKNSAVMGALLCKVCLAPH